MTTKEILNELKELGAPGTKKILLNHGAREPLFGVKIGDLKKVQKRIKTNYQLALDLFDTGNYDAMYLAGLIADDAKMTRQDLRSWMAKAYCSPLAGSVVARVTAGSPHGYALALEWIESRRELTAEAGWTTLSTIVSVQADAELNLPELGRLLQRVRKTIHQQPDRVRYAMNNFVIAAGGFVKALTGSALDVAESIGAVTVDMGNTACQVPFAPDYIRKIQQRGTPGTKRPSTRG